MRVVVTGLSWRAVGYVMGRIIGGQQAEVSSFGPPSRFSTDLPEYAEIDCHPGWLERIDYTQRQHPGIRILVIPEDPRDYVAWIEKEVRETGELSQEFEFLGEIPDLIRDRFEKIYFGGEELLLDRFRALQDVFDRPVGVETLRAIPLEAIQEGEQGTRLAGILKCGVEASKLPQDQRIHWSDYLSRFSAGDILQTCPGIAIAMGLVGNPSGTRKVNRTPEAEGAPATT